MQFGVFSVSDITTDPTTGRTPTEAERIKAVVAIAKKAEEVGLDVFALGEHHNPPFFSSSPTTTLGYIAAQTERLQLSTATTLITTNDPVKIAEDYAMLQHLADGRVDLMMGRGNTGPVYPWFGKDIRDGIPLAIENYALLRRLWREDVVDWEGRFRTPLQGFTSTPRPLDGVAAVRLARLDPQPGDRRAGRLLRRRLLPQPHLLAGRAHPADGRVLPPPVRALRPRPAPTRRSSASAGRCSCGRTARTPSASSGPTSTTRPVYGHGPSLEDFSRETPLTVGSPQQVIERTLGFRDYVGDYQRQLFLIDHAGLPLKTVLEQLDILGEEVVPVLRREFAALKPAHVPDAPTHASLVAARRRGRRTSAPPTCPGRRWTCDDHPHPRRRQRRALGPVVDPAAGRPARRRDRRGPRARGVSTRPSRSSSCASTPATWPTTWSPGSRTRACGPPSTRWSAPTG